MSGTKLFHHPTVGDLELEFEVLHLPDTSGQRVTTYTAVPDSPAQAALQLLSATRAVDTDAHEVRIDGSAATA